MLLLSLISFHQQIRLFFYLKKTRIIWHTGGNYVNTSKIWITSLNSLNKKFTWLYLHKNTSLFLFNSKNVFVRKLTHQTLRLIKDYNYLILTFLKKQQKQTKKLITFSSLSLNIEYLQQCFIESNAICLEAIKLFKASAESLIPGVDNIAFTNVKIEKRRQALRYLRSKKKKSFSALTSTSIKTLKNKVRIHNIQLFARMYQECTYLLTKKIRHIAPQKYVQYFNQKSQRVCFYQLPVLRDRILQQLIKLALIPFSKNVFFVLYSTRQVVANIILILSKKLLIVKQLYFKSYKQFCILFSKNYTYISNTPKSSESAYLSMYPTAYILKRFIILRRLRCKTLAIPFYFRYLIFSIKNYFEQVHRKTLLKFLPICTQFWYLIKLWLFAPLYTFTYRKKKLKQKILAGTVINSLLCNILLMTLETQLFLYLTCYHSYLFLKLPTTFIKKNLLISLYRYTSTFLLIGKGSKYQLACIQIKILKYLFKIGFYKATFNFSVRVFNPMNCFTYLGFKFQYCITFMKKKCGISSNIQQSLYGYTLLLNICFFSFKNIKQQLKTLFRANRLFMSITSLLRYYRLWLFKITLYYGLTTRLQKQLVALQFYAHTKFRRFLLRKFGSKPQLKTYINKF